MGKSESGQIPVLCSKGREARDEYTQGAYEICKTFAQKYEICVAMFGKYYVNACITGKRAWTHSVT